MGAPRILHPDLSAEGRRILLVRGVEHFNRRSFYAAHDDWEEVWRSTAPEPRTLLQGLIQAAAGLHQILELRREAGPRGTLAKSVVNLEPYRPAALGLGIEKLVLDLERVRLWLDADRELRPAEPPMPQLRVIDPAALV
jgi:predicted metal-dependent hydrolase